ncbi:GIY-YIG nuclease family protein [Xanthomonas axonopodis pv. ricini]|uniref:GIY-YIG nuclease family protein n=1 Tax=Xanthomonas euvesicatoria TaxID=456327 RepID=UPI002454D03C|nr:GIY-YIG nuclease family protein [Xanthomonas euvesicatoria]MDH4907189.1 GIY-YIG nuclease family protein [Xanthomonas euvesicatoria]
MSARSPGSTPVAIDGRCFTYVFPCQWEDHCKIGFSRDPLGRIGSLHPRWFDFFDLEHGLLVETERERDARDLELQLRRPLLAHNAPAPMAIRAVAGGRTEWFRGVGEALQRAVAQLQQGGYRVFVLRDWLQAAMAQRIDRLYDWAAVQLSADELDGLVGPTPAQRALRDVLDGYRALDLPVQAHVPEHIWAWYCRNG